MNAILESIIALIMIIVMFVFYLVLAILAIMAAVAMSPILLGIWLADKSKKTPDSEHH